MKHDYHYSVLSVYPISQGLAFVLFESPARPVDWGVKIIAGKVKHLNMRALEYVESLLDRYHPDVITIENFNEERSKRADRVKRLYLSIMNAAQARGIDVTEIGKEDVATTFDLVGAATKYEVAKAVGVLFPEFAARLPSKRHIWESEKSIMGLFEAASRAITFYADGTKTDGV